ncbi:MAG: DUF3135 domain-containing protein [Gammaproteobacteria bacterium]|nr:DUF3135 domain-containing protein [Gammaproteobacteria bacterium]
MAKENPEEFEKLRLEAINEVIESAPELHRQRLRCLQWRIDQERRRASNPLSACLRLSQMMWESVSGSGGLLENLSQLQAGMTGEGSAVAKLGPKAEVVPLHSGMIR